MNLFRELFPRITKTAVESERDRAYAEADVSNETIMDAAGATMRYCAISAFNGTISTSGNLTFDKWLRCCETSWIPKVASRLGVSNQRVIDATRQFAMSNAAREAELEAGLSGTILKPGQTVEVRL